MVLELERSRFLRPRDTLYELIVLQQVASFASNELGIQFFAFVDRRTLAGYVKRLEDRGLLCTAEGNVGRLMELTDLGAQRLRSLTVDYARELTTLHRGAVHLLRRGFVSLALDGVERIAFYPYGETADIAYEAIEGLGFEMVAIVDDSKMIQASVFHDLRIQPPESLLDLDLDAVIVTTAVFQKEVLSRLNAMGLNDLRVHLL